ncbi:MAG: acylphosphatase [Yaniella sp.]|nr:acylphosphatase [Yaniella sp.]
MPARETLSITQIRTYAYRVPERPGSTSRPTNVVVTVTANAPDGTRIQGVGEGQPRGWRTGDDAGDYWAFLAVAAKELPGYNIAISEPAEALDAVRDVMKGIEELAQSRAEEPQHKHPFRGTMLGIEVALLDLISSARNETLSRLLGQRRDTAPLMGIALSPNTDPETLKANLNEQANTQQFARLIGVDDPAANIEFLDTVAAINRELGVPDKPLLLDLDGALNREQATLCVRMIAKGVNNGTLPNEVILEQPVPLLYSDHLGTLQMEANEAIQNAKRSGLELRIQGDESVWDVHSASRLKKVGGVRGINIRPARAGGLLTALDLADRVAKENPDTRIFLSRMSGCSHLTTYPLQHLALALPRIDGAVVSPVVNSSIKMSSLKPANASSLVDDKNTESETNVASGNSRPDEFRRFGIRNVSGHGTELRLAGLISEVTTALIFPEAPPPNYNGIPVSIYNDVDDLHPLGPNGSKGHLLEREALALGLNTARYSKGAFTATDGKHEPVPFKWSRNPLSSATALALCTHKEATRMQLQLAGVPVPQGRTFARGDYTTAKEFVKRIGYPVVVKPTMGVRGIGVVAGIQNEGQLDAAFKLMSGSKLGDQDFIVEKHVNGADYRIVVIGDEVIAAIQREPSSVFGDGYSTIGELLINKNVARRRNPHLWARPAKFDEAARHELRKVGRDLDTVLEKGEQQLLANTCSLSQGGDSIDVLDEMHPSIKEASVAAVKAMPGLYFCGVDFLLEDHTKPLDQQDAGICELNAHAAIGNCEYPMFGAGRPVAKTMMQATVDHFGFESHDERAERLALHLTIRGRVTGVGYRDWLKRRAGISGLSGWVRNVNKRTVEAVLVGNTDPTTAVAAATILGPKRAVPTAYEAKQIPVPEGLAGFEIHEDAPRGTAVEAIDAT